MKNKFNVGDIVTFNNIFEVERLAARDGQRCVVTYVLTEDELIETEFDFPHCEVVFDDGGMECADVTTLTFVGSLKAGDLAVLREDNSPCVIKSILLPAKEFDHSRAEVVLDGGEEKTVLLTALVPMSNTIYSKFTDPEFIKMTKEKYNG